MEPVENYGLDQEEYFDMVETEDGEMDRLVDDEELDWLELARDAFKTSDTYFNSSIRKQIEKNINMFNSRHAAGSKYNQPSYKYRSKIFRPKTRSSIRRHEAAAAAAYFSTKDVVVVTADNQADKMAVFGAEVGENLVNTRLQDPKLRWFQTCVGAYQDAMVQGVVVSRQEWLYKEVRTPLELRDEIVEVLPQSYASQVPTETIEIIEDRPTIDIIPLENFRFDPAADWRDPIQSSPYLIELLPMYRGDIEARIKGDNPNEPPWIAFPEEVTSSEWMMKITSSTLSGRHIS